MRFKTNSKYCPISGIRFPLQMPSSPDLQVKIQNANMEINRKNEEILNFEQIQKSMKNSESYKDLSQFALENVQKYMDQRKNFLLAALTITRNTMVKNPEFQNLLNPLLILMTCLLTICIYTLLKPSFRNFLWTFMQRKLWKSVT